MLLHVVLFKFRQDTTAELRSELSHRLARLGEACGGDDGGLLYWQVANNLDLRKGYAVMEVAVFRDEQALQAFRTHPEHVQTADEMSRHADWVVGDCPTMEGLLFRPDS